MFLVPEQLLMERRLGGPPPLILFGEGMVGGLLVRFGLVLLVLPVVAQYPPEFLFALALELASAAAALRLHKVPDAGPFGLLQHVI